MSNLYHISSCVSWIIVLTDKELQVLMLRKKGLLQTEIAKQLGMTQSAISRFEASATRKAQEAKRQLDLLHKLGIDICAETIRAYPALPAPDILHDEEGV